MDPVRSLEAAAIRLSYAPVEVEELGPAEWVTEVVTGQVPKGVVLLHDIDLGW